MSKLNKGLFSSKDQTWETPIDFFNKLDGIFKFDDIDKYICFTMKTIAAYTNLELSDDMEEDYDELCRAKLLDIIIIFFRRFLLTSKLWKDLKHNLIKKKVVIKLYLKLNAIG